MSMTYCTVVWDTLNITQPMPGCTADGVQHTVEVPSQMCCYPPKPQSALLACQAEQTKYEARIVGLQRAKLEAAAKADAQWQRAEALQQELDKLAGENARWTENACAAFPITKSQADRLHERCSGFSGQRPVISWPRYR